MKIGILTFHCANNFGAVLQAYALSKYLGIDHEVYIIDYKPLYLNKTTYFFPILKDVKRRPVRFVKEVLKSILNCKDKLEMLEKFSNFRQNYLPLYILKNNIDITGFDTIIVGSDQVWNIEITEGFDPYFWGDKIPSKTKLISYAASTGRYIFNKNELEIVKKKISKFSAISVRENNIKAFLSDLLHKDIKFVLDPTFLIDKNIYIKLCGERPLYSQKYVLIYEVVHDNNTERIAIELAKQLGVKIVRIGSKTKDNRIKSVINLGPKEFLNYIYYSSFIVTTSFHGTAFSIILNKDFYTINLCNEIDDRSLTLLTSLSLVDRYINKLSTPSVKKINYEIVNKQIGELVNNSQRYLKNNI